MPLAPALPWIDLDRRLRTIPRGLRLRRELARADGIVKKLLTPIDWPLPYYFVRLEPSARGQAPPDRDDREPSAGTFKELLRGRGEITYEAPIDESRKTPLYEYPGTTPPCTR